MLINARSCERACASKPIERDQVTQRPGCSSLATSVSTLTVGSQATTILRSGFFGACLLTDVGARLRAYLSTETRTSTEVSVRL